MALPYRFQSPTNSFFFRSNDDQLERAQARAAALAAAIRRKATTIASPSPPDHPCLTKEQIVGLFQNCIKLASENKINQKNTWELKLIDHLSEIIKVELEGDSESNFQKASCTLEAGVKIYSVRVDAMHSEAYKVLGRIKRAGLEDEQEVMTEGDDVSRQQDWSYSKKESEKKISPLSTLESSFEALNVKRFDVEFAVDPLYHQTSAQFDEGGAKGLLLNNLGVYGGCCVLFDSLEVPGRCISCSQKNDTLDMIDVSFAKESMEQIMMNMLAKDDISPTLRDILCHFNEDDQRPSGTFTVDKNFDVRNLFDTSEVEMESSSFGNYEARTFNHDDETIIFSESFACDSTLPSHHEDNEPCASSEPGADQSFDNVTMFLFQGLEINPKQNRWAGPDHWKFHEYKYDSPTSESGLAFTSKRRNEKIQPEIDIDFMILLDSERVDVFSPPKSAKSLVLPANRAPCNNTLPEDFHYQPENLVKLFLLPNVLCLGKQIMGQSDNKSWQPMNDFDEASPSWDDESVLSGQNHAGNFQGVEDGDELISQPRQGLDIFQTCIGHISC